MPVELGANVMPEMLSGGLSVPVDAPGGAVKVPLGAQKVPHRVRGGREICGLRLSSV